MRAVLLAGGLGTRFAEETDVRPKPMIEIGGKPILWHIMKIYSSHGINDFIICLGYKGYVIKEYFSNYFLHQSNVTFDLRENRMEVLHKHAEPWRVTLIDTGEETMIGGRIKRIHGPFVSDHEVEDVVRFLKSQGTPEYLDAVTEEPDEESEDPYALMGSGGNRESGDDLYDKALAVVARDKKASTSYIQRRLQIGYNRAASLIERMEQDGVVSSPNHKGVREVLLPDHEQ